MGFAGHGGESDVEGGFQRLAGSGCNYACPVSGEEVESLFDRDPEQSGNLGSEAWGFEEAFRVPEGFNIIF